MKNPRCPRLVIDKSLKSSPAIEQLMVGFVPRFGDTDDIKINTLYGVAKVLKAKVARYRTKIEMLNRVENDKKKNIRLLKETEERLMYLLKKRK